MLDVNERLLTERNPDIENQGMSCLRRLKLAGAVALGLALGCGNEAIPPEPESAEAAEREPAEAAHTFRKIKLSGEFLCEGASHGDFNHDGQQDIVAGPYWYEGPEFALSPPRTARP